MANRDRPDTSKAIPAPKKMMGEDSREMKRLADRSSAAAIRLIAKRRRLHFVVAFSGCSVSPLRSEVAGSLTRERSVTSREKRIAAKETKNPMTNVTGSTWRERNDDPIAAIHIV